MKIFNTNRGVPALTAAAAVLVFVAYLTLLPATLRHTEAVGFFAWLPDFVADTLQQPAGAGLLAAAFLEQFFGRPWAGAAILVALQLVTVGASYALLCRSPHGEALRSYTLFIYVFLAVCAPPSVFLLLSVVVVQGLAALYLTLRRPWARRIALVLLPAGYVLVPEPLLLVLGAELILAEAFLLRCRTNAGVAAAFTALLLALPPLWSAQVAFVPPARYYTWGAQGAGISLPLLAAVLLLPAVLWAPGRRRAPLSAKAGRAVTVAVLGLIVLAGVLSPIKERRAEEDVFTLEQAADEGRWEEVLRLSADKAREADAFCLRYALLAESAQGTLPEHLFQYPVTAPEQFMFRNSFSLPSCHFNALFYRNMDVPDEAFHQSFESGVLSPAGHSMRSLRQMTDAALEMGDAPLARKYMDVLAHTATHGRWLAERRPRLQDLQAQSDGPAKAPLRSRNYVGSIDLGNELVYALELDTANRRMLDYLLCNFLLKKRPEKVARLMELNPQYVGRPLPAPYAQAMALFADQRPQWQGRFLVPPQTVQEWRQCLRLQQAGRMNELAQRCAGTYWYYLFFVNPAPAHP